MPANTVSVARPTKWGNPFHVDEHLNRTGAVQAFRLLIEAFDEPLPFERHLHELRGKNLACWCPLCEAHKDGKPFGVECSDCSPCHADVLLELANAASLRARAALRSGE
jgi:hypothetical protein